MLGDTQTITYDGASKVLSKINQDGYSAEYYLDDLTNDRVHRLTVKHTIPARGEPGESHMARLDTDIFASGEYQRTESAWTVLKTFDGVQTGASLLKTGEALDGLVDATLMGKIVNRES